MMYERANEMEQKSEIALKIAEATTTAKGGFFSTIIGIVMLFFSNLTVAEIVGLVMAAVGIVVQVLNQWRAWRMSQIEERTERAKARYYESKIKRETEGADSMWSEL